MRNRRWLGVLFVCLALVQIGMAASMIIRREATLRNGRQFRFRVTSLGPYTSAQGRYVPIVIESEKLPFVPDGPLQPGRSVRALIEVDGEGFAQLRGKLASRSDACIQADARFVERGFLRLRLPFDRYYVEPELAPRAEEACRRQSAAKAGSAHITVRVSGDFAVLEELYIEGKPVSQFLQSPR